MKTRAFSGVELSHRVELSGDRITVVGGKKVLIEGNRGILECSDCRIIVSTPGGRLIVTGAGLSIDAMTGEELLIQGRICSVEWE